MFRAPPTHQRWPTNRKQRRASGKDRQQRSHGDTAEAVDQRLESALGHHRAGRLDKTERPVLTASAAQVRRPIYTSSVERWRLFERHLSALRQALGPADAARRLPRRP